MINSASPDLNDPTAPQSDGGRLAFVDVLRVVVIILVVAHHSAQPYGPTGGEWAVTDPANTEWLGPFFAVNAAFGLGLLFLLAGYFVPRICPGDECAGRVPDRVGAALYGRIRPIAL
jgi:peptidoglycan/LPS O-acetylase OafA/YrhL